MTLLFDDAFLSADADESKPKKTKTKKPAAGSDSDASMDMPPKKKKAPAKVYLFSSFLCVFTYCFLLTRNLHRWRNLLY